LADIAPTILNILNIDKPKLMTGKILIWKNLYSYL
jgi:bisphosphoglycerate-independent phosphoglycerate mutase (AlkP superfamily)